MKVDKGVYTLIYQLAGLGVCISNALRNLLSPRVRALATISPSQQLYSHPRHKPLQVT